MQTDRYLIKDSQISEYILFLNSLELKTNIVEIIDRRSRFSDAEAPPAKKGWATIESIVCINDNSEIYEIDIRYAWSHQIFQQHLYDHGWNESILLTAREQQSRHKRIIYLCEPSTTLVDSIQDRPVASEFIIGNYWQSIHHFYLLLPFSHPFELPELLDSHFDSVSSLSTTIEPEKDVLSGGLRTKGVCKVGTIDRPLISVITVVFNGEQKIAQTIQSVINQDYENVEYIIIDGGSSDRTIEIIGQYADRIDYWQSARDLGIYDAMNKGIDLATGEWLNFMNCGDLFYSYQSLSAIPLKSNVDFYYSDAILYNSRGNTELWVCSQEQRVLTHQSIVYRKNLHSNYQYLVHNRLTISDYFFFRQNDAKNWCKLDSPISIYNTEGTSNSSSSGFVQRLFVNFISGDISELQISLLIMAKILRSPLRIIRSMLIQLGIFKSSRNS
jgi:Glycosyl transferase family 2